jgi:hypothetical protein
MPDPPLADVLAVLDAYQKWGRRVFHAVPHRGVCLAATDANWRQAPDRKLEERRSTSCCWSPTGGRSSTASRALA